MTDLLEFGYQTYAVAYVTVGCTTAILYDYVLTIGDEIRCIWPSQASIPKILFLTNRYIILPMIVFTAIASLRNHLSAGFCVFYLKWIIILITAANCVMGAILLTRVIALYRNNKTAKALASFFFAGGTVVLTVFSIKDALEDQIQVSENLNVLPGCFPTSPPEALVVYWIVPIITESMLFALVVWRVIAWSRSELQVSPALRLMARDSAIYFAVIFVLLLVSLVVFELAPPSLATLFIQPVITSGCIAGSRMLLNLRTLSDVKLDDREIEMGRMNYFGSDFARSALRFGSNTQVTAVISTTVYPSFSAQTVEVDLENLNEPGRRGIGDYKNPSSY